MRPKSENYLEVSYKLNRSWGVLAFRYTYSQNKRIAPKLSGCHSKVDRFLAAIHIQKCRLLSRTLKRPLLDIDTRIDGFGHFVSLPKLGNIWNLRVGTGVPHRFLAVVIHLGPGGTAAPQTSKPAGSNKWSSTFAQQMLSVLVSLIISGNRKQNLHPRGSCYCREANKSTANTPDPILNPTLDHTIAIIFTLIPALKRR